LLAVVARETHAACPHQPFHTRPRHTPTQQADPAWADKLLLPDKLHLSSEGNKKLYDQIMQALETQVPAMAWRNVPLHYPLMDAIDKVWRLRACVHVCMCMHRRAVPGMRTVSRLHGPTAALHPLLCCAVLCGCATPVPATTGRPWRCL
jgi:hypothetical protein